MKKSSLLTISILWVVAAASPAQTRTDESWPYHPAAAGWFQRAYTCVQSKLTGFEGKQTLVNAGCESMFYVNDAQGWNRGNADGARHAGWLTSSAAMYHVTFRAAGISNWLNGDLAKFSVGDMNAIDFNLIVKPGWVDASGEGITGVQNKLIEDAPLLGTVHAGGGGTSARTIFFECNSQCGHQGVGQPLVDLSDDVVKGRITAIQSHPTPSGTVSIANVSFAVNESSVCGTLDDALDKDPAPYDTTGYGATLQTWSVATPQDLTPLLHRILVIQGHFLEQIEIQRVGPYGAERPGHQTITAYVQHTYSVGSPFCAGGWAGRWLWQDDHVQFGRRYLHHVIGSVSGNRLIVASIAHAILYSLDAAGPITVVHGGDVVSVLNPATGLRDDEHLVVGPNDALWSDGAKIEHANTLAARYAMQNNAINSLNPYAEIAGSSLTFNTASMFGGIAIPLLHQMDPRLFHDHGGRDQAMIGMFLDGIWGSAIFYANTPESTYWSGNLFGNAVINMGDPLPGAEKTWGLVRMRENGDGISYDSARRQWQMDARGGLSVQGNTDVHGALSAVSIAASAPAPPSSSVSNCPSPGAMWHDENFLYVCTRNSIKRIALGSF